MTVESGADGRECDGLNWYDGRTLVASEIESGEAGVAVSSYTFGEGVLPPLFIHTASASVEGGGLSGSLKYRDPCNEHAIQAGAQTFGASPGSYMWLCIDSVSPDDPTNFGAGTATWDGLLFFHTEEHPNVAEDGPLDVVFRLHHIGCSGEEDASWLADTDYCVNWGFDCDGLDNDLDGLVDEGQASADYPLDADGNGTPDCMDDWDGDGVPNTSDDNVTECCMFEGFCE